MRVVVFDLGQVILQWDPYLTQTGKLNRHEWLDFLERTDFWKSNQALDEGVAPEQVYREFRRAYPDDAEVFERFLHHHTASVTAVVPGMERLVSALQRSRVRLAALSNWSAALFPATATRFPILKAFDPLILSGQVHLAKPDPRIFELLYRRLGCAPHEVIFTDDQPLNVAAARASGADGIVFEDAAQLAQALVSREVLRADWKRLRIEGRLETID